MRKTNKKVRFDLVMRDEKFPRNWVRTGIHSVSPRRVNRIHQQAESGQYPNQPSKNRCRSFPRGVVTAKRLSSVRIQSREMCQDQQSISMRYGPRLTLFLNAIIKRNSQYATVLVVTLDFRKRQLPRRMGLHIISPSGFGYTS